MPMLSRRRAASLLLALAFVLPAGTFAQHRPGNRRRAPAQQPSMAALVDAVKSRGEDTVLSGYVAVVMDIATDYLEQVPARAIALRGDATHSRLLCLVTRNRVDTILMIELAGAQITAYSVTPGGVLKKAARGMQYEEFQLIPEAQASVGFKAAKEFWLRQIASTSPPVNKAE